MRRDGFLPRAKNRLPLPRFQTRRRKEQVWAEGNLGCETGSQVLAQKTDESQRGSRKGRSEREGRPRAETTPRFRRVGIFRSKTPTATDPFWWSWCNPTPAWESPRIPSPPRKRTAPISRLDRQGAKKRRGRRPILGKRPAPTSPSPDWRDVPTAAARRFEKDNTPRKRETNPARRKDSAAPRERANEAPVRGRRTTPTFPSRWKTRRGVGGFEAKEASGSVLRLPCQSRSPTLARAAVPWRKSGVAP